MSFPVSTVLDEFNRANGGLGTNWEAASNLKALRIINEECASIESGEESGALWKETFSEKQASFVTTKIISTKTYYELYLRYTAATESLYLFEIEGSSTLRLAKVIKGVYSVIASTTATSFSSGDVFGFTIEGTNLKAWHGKTFSELSLVGEETDISVIGSGKIGLGMTGTTSRADNFGGGAIGPIEIKPTFSSSVTVSESFKSQIKFPSIYEEKSSLIINTQSLSKLQPRYVFNRPPTYRSPRRLFKPYYGIYEKVKNLFPFISTFNSKGELSTSIKSHGNIKPTFESKVQFSNSIKVSGKINPIFESKSALSDLIKSFVKAKINIEESANLIINLVDRVVNILSKFEVKTSFISNIKNNVQVHPTFETKIENNYRLRSHINIPTNFTVEGRLQIDLKDNKLSIRPDFLVTTEFILSLTSSKLFPETNKILRTGPLVIVVPTLSNTHTATVDWRWWLVNTSDMSQITELNSAHDRKLQLMLNQPGTANFWLHLLDPVASLIEEHSTSIVCYRNSKAIWSGPIYTAKEISNSNTDQLEVTAMGWYQNFNSRMLHTGSEWTEMVVKAVAEGRIGGYTPLSQEQAIEISYGEYPIGSGSYPGVPLGLIGADLIERANIDVPTHVTMGEIPETTNSIILTLNQFQNIGEQFTKLSNIESGFDFYIDPLTRKLHIVRNTIRENIAGLGVDRGPGIRFTYPGNCIGAERTGEGLKTRNRFEVIGQYDVEKAESLDSIQKNGLFEEEASIVDGLGEEEPKILRAYAAIQVLTLEKPFTIVTFEPKGIEYTDVLIPSVPRPFEDYELGDFVYTTIERGPRFKVGTWSNPKPVRVYGMSINIEDNGTEKINSIQTTYSN
jgi:hypothetical protein